MKNLILSLCACFVLFTSNAQSFREQFTEANILSEDGYYGLAIPLWEKLLEESPDNANLNYKLGKCYLEMGLNREEALPYLKKAITNVKKVYDPFSSDVKSTPVEAYYYYALCQLIVTDLDEADTYYAKFLADASKKHFLRPNAERGLDMISNAREFMADPVDVDIVNIGTPINSPFAEYSPILALDENTLYFTSRRLRSDSSNKNDLDPRSGLHYEDMYVSYRTMQGAWMEPELLSINVADAHSSVVSMSPDGRTLYIYKTYRGIGNLYQSDFRLGEGWSIPKLVGGDVNSKSNEFFATVTVDGQRLYFVSDRKGGLGGKDIWYVQKLPTGEWGKAINPGAPINTEFDEDAPYIHPDGKTMYFSSNGHKSMGGYDIFMTMMDDEGNWITPQNVGYPINTTDDDHSYVAAPSGTRAYYSSKGSDSEGSTDIYVIEYPPGPDEPAIADVGSFAIVKGWVLASDGSSLPSDVLITVKDLNDNVTKGEARPVPRNGSFVFVIPTGSKYEITYAVGDKIVNSETIDIPEGSEYLELNREIILTPREDGEMNAVAFTDNVLGDVLKWQLKMNSPDKGVPIGSKVYFLDENDAIIDSAYISKDGYFAYKKLMADGNVRIKPVVDGADNSQLNLELYRAEETDPTMNLVYQDGTFALETDEAAAEEPETPAEETASVEEVKAEEKQEKAEETKVNDERAKLKDKEPSFEAQTAFTFNLGYNKTAVSASNADFQSAVSNALALLKSNGKLTLTIEGSASHVPTSSFESNEALAKERAERFEKQLRAALAGKGANINMISTNKLKSGVNGPDYDASTKGKHNLFTDFQYVKLKLD